LSQDSLYSNATGACESKLAEDDDEEDGDGFDFTIDCSDYHGEISLHPATVVAPSIPGNDAALVMEASFSVSTYGRSESALFFSEQHKRKKDNGGIVYLVNKAQTQQTTVLAHADGEENSKEEYGLHNCH
jgi:hypothetical protein